MLSLWQKLALLALAGGLGSLSRYGLAGLVQRLHGGSYPLGTAVVNILGCLLFGLAWAAADKRMHWETEFRLIVLTGFMGAFTTFSTYIFETGTLHRDGQWGALALNLLGQNALGLAALFLGLSLGRAL